MRQVLALGSLLVALGGCFEDSDPVDETGAMQSSGEECTPGTESCPCIEGGCVNDLVCLSNVCVDAGSTSAATTNEPETSTTAATSTSGPATTSVDTTPMTSTSGPLDEGPVTSDSSGGLPQGAPCDPFADECQPGLACVGVEMTGLVCDAPGMASQDNPCDQELCGAGLLCMQAQVLDTCMSMVACCTAMCDLTGSGECPTSLHCEPFYPMGKAPPGYEGLGVCIS